MHVAWHCPAAATLCILLPHCAWQVHAVRVPVSAVKSNLAVSPIVMRNSPFAREARQLSDRADAAAIRALVQSWLWPLWVLPAVHLELHFQHIIAGATRLPCRAVKSLQPISWTSQRLLTCPCHGLPMRPGGAVPSFPPICLFTLFGKQGNFLHSEDDLHDC